MNLNETTPEQWRSLPFSHDSAGRQLALSESLINELTAPSLYWYQAIRPAFILGAAQKPELLDFGRQPEAYKRTSGGTLVLTGESFLSLDVALPPTSRFFQTDVTRAYLWFGQVWVETLARLGIRARLIEPDEARAARQQLESSTPEEKLVKLVCFGTVSAYEVVTENGLKIVGLAQIRRRSGTLLQAGIHLNWPAAEFAQVLALSSTERQSLASQLQTRATGLQEMLGLQPTVQEIITTFEKSLTDLLPVELVPTTWTSAELEAAHRLEQEKFRPFSSVIEKEN